MNSPDFFLSMKRYRKKFRPLRRLARIVRVFSVVSVVLFGFSLLSMMVNGRGEKEFGHIEPSASNTAFIFVGQAILFIAYISFCIWLWRATRNRHVLSDFRRVYFDVIIIFCCLIPSLSVLLSWYYFSVLYNESRPSAGTTTRFRIPNFIGKRFSAIVLSFVGLITFQTVVIIVVFGGGRLGNPAKWAWLELASYPVAVVVVAIMCWAWISMVNKITERQHAEFERQETPCPSCGEPLAETVESCPLCGHDLKEVKAGE